MMCQWLLSLSGLMSLITHWWWWFKFMSGCKFGFKGIITDVITENINGWFFIHDDSSGLKTVFPIHLTNHNESTIATVIRQLCWNALFMRDSMLVSRIMNLII